MKKITILFLILATLFLPACSSEGNGLKTFKGTKDIPLTFEYPVALKEIESTSKGISSVFTDNEITVSLTFDEYPVNAPAASKFAESLVTEFTNSPTSLGVSNFKKVNFEEVLYDERYKAGILISEYQVDQTGQEIVSTAYMIPHGPKMYTVSINALKDSYESRKADIDRIIKSVKITK